LTVEESACWSHIFATNNITQVVADSHIAEATGIPEPKVAKAVAALVQAGLVREIDRLRTAFFDARFGQVLDEGATKAATKRRCVGNANAGQKFEVGIENFEALLDQQMKTAGVKGHVAQSKPQKPTDGLVS
jgi:hypothetical protein